MNCFFDREEITPQIWIALAVVGIIVYIAIFHIDSIIGEENAEVLHAKTESCPVACEDHNEKTCDTIHKFRDDGYYILDGESDRCIVTWWEISHVIFHALLGYFTDIYVASTISVGFELYEHYALDCGSWLDLLYNFLGVCIGRALKCTVG